MTTTALGFPALEGRTVTQAHVKKCNQQGHAVHTVEGVASPLCPRCGAAPRTRATVTNTLTTAELVQLAAEEPGQLCRVVIGQKVVRGYISPCNRTSGGARLDSYTHVTVCRPSGTFVRTPVASITTLELL